MNASIAKLSKKTIEMKSNITDNTLGGQYFSGVLEKYLIEKVTKQYKIDPRKNERAMIRFKQACEKAKKTLSSNPVVLFEIPFLMNDIDVTFPLKREEFNELIKTFLPKIKSNIELAIEKSGIAKEDISYVEIVGGSSRIPIFKESIKEIVGKVPKMSLDLDECFAIGAGHLSSQIDGNDIGIEIVNKNICPYSIDVQLTDHETETLNIFNEEETKLPSSFKFSFPASKTKTLKFYCNKSEIGKLEILNENQKESETEVTVSIDSFGIIKIENVSNSTFSYKPKMTFSEQEILKYQNLEEIQDKQDKLEIEIDNTKNELESLIFSTESEINSHNFDEETKKKIHSIHRWFDENEFERLSLNEYKSKIHEIKMIMNENMKKMLDGIRQSLQEALDDIQKDAERAKLSESLSLLNEISKKIELVDLFLESPNEKLLQKDIGGLLEEAGRIRNKVENLKKMPVTVKRHAKRRRRMNGRNDRGQRFDQWSPFGVRNNFFGGFFGNPWQNDDYEYEYCYDDDAEFEKQEQERKRKILQEDERKRQEFLMEQERKKQIGRGRMRRSKVNNYSSEEDDFSYLSRVKKEAQKDDEMQVRQEQEKQRQIEIENRRRAQIEQEGVRRAKEAEMQRRAANSPWSSTMHSPYGQRFNPLYQSAQPRQQRRVMPGYGYPWGF